MKRLATFMWVEMALAACGGSDGSTSGGIPSPTALHHGLQRNPGAGRAAG